MLLATSARLTTSETRAVIDTLAASHPGYIESFDQSRPGLGIAVREAFTRAQGDAIVVMAADGETPAAALPLMLEKFQQGYDIVASNRWSHGITFNGYHPIKLLLAYIFQQFFRVLYLTHLHDLTFGFRVYKPSVVNAIRFEEDRHPFFFEAILKALRLGYSIGEVDAPWDMFTSRTSSVGRAKKIDLVGYVRAGLRIRFMSVAKMLRDSSTPRDDSRYN